MTPEQWQQVKEIFNSALQYEPGQRSVFISNACGGDEFLIHEVASLISSHEKDGSFIDSPAYEVAAELLTTGRELLPGQRVGHYEILSTLGKGGMGEVYLAEDTRLGRKVALKFLPSSLSGDQDRLVRFEREARAASALNHPNILTIYEVGSGDSRRFIATEYVVGETLRQRMVHSRLRVAEALDVAIQVASALAAAHQAGILHRDIKPENIMRRDDGYVKVVDFGLAKLTETQTIPGSSQRTALQNDTDTGMIMGTPAYMSPEQARGLPLDVRSDIWSLGVVLYEMITARLPFQGETSSHMVVSILEREPPPVSASTAEVPPEIEWIVRKALRKDKDERYQTARELLGDLKNLKHRLDFQMPVESPPAPETSRENSPARHVTDLHQGHSTGQESLLQGKQKTTAAVLAVLMVLILGASLVFAAYKYLVTQRNADPKSNYSAVDRQPELRLLQLTSWSGLDLFPAFSPDDNSIVYSSDHTGTFEIYIKQLTPGGREIQLTSDGQQNFEPDWSPDGKVIAYHSRSRGGIWVVAALGGVPKQLADFGSHPRWSPDGSVIAFQSTALTDFSPTAPAAMPPATLWIIPAAGGAPHQITQTGNPVGGHGAPSWSPDGKRIVFAASFGNGGGIWSVASNGSDLQLLHKSNSFSPVYSSDGASVYFAGGDPAGASWGLKRLSVSPETGKPQGEARVIKNTGSTLYKHLRVSSDGKKIACSALQFKNDLMTISLAPGLGGAAKAPVALTQDTNYRKYAPAFSPDGRKLAYNVVRIGSTDELWIVDADGKNPTAINLDPDNDCSWPSWFPEGNRIAYSSNGGKSLRVLDLQTARDQVLFETEDRMGWAKLSPDGKQVAFNSTKSGAVNVWTMAIEGGQARQLTFDNELMGFPSWSPDSRLIAFEMKRGDDAHVAIMPSAGGPPVQLTSAPGQDFVNTWSPDGSRVAFAGQRNGIWNIYWVSIKDKTEKKLTDYTKLNAYVRYPSWSSLGNQIVYEYSETTGNVWLIEVK